MANVTYNGRGMSPRDRLLGRKDAPHAVAEAKLPPAVWTEPTARNLFREGYKINSAVFASVRALYTAFSEPPLLCYTDETQRKVVPNHPLRKLIRRPNSLMGEKEFWRFVIVYSSIGGNSYSQIVPTEGGLLPAEIWPYSDTQMGPIPSGRKWIDHYEYSADGVNRTKVPAEEIIHFKWAPDPLKPWRGMPALYPVAREVDTDNELTRYLKALLQNDVVVRGLVTYPPGVSITPSLREEIKKAWRKLFGGENRGDIAIMDQGGDYKRVALDMEELAFDALRGVPEARISAAFGVPALVAGLSIGLREGREGNWESTRKQFTEQTLCPLWEAVASEVQQSLVPWYGNDVYVGFDLSRVRALTEQNKERDFRVFQAYKLGLYTVDEARTDLGKPAIGGAEGERRYTSPAPAVAQGAPSQGDGDGATTDDTAKGDVVLAGVVPHRNGKAT